MRERITDNINLREIDLLTLLPQQPPFVMVDELIGYDNTSTSTLTQVKEDNIFVENGVLTPEGILENVAQTCAARIGFINKYILGCDINIGYIGAVKKFRFFAIPEVDSKIFTKIRVREEIFGFTLIQAEVRFAGGSNELIAKGEMKIAIKGEE